MHRVFAGLLVLISVPARADSPTEPDPAADVRAAATAFLTALDAGADEVIEVAFASTVKLARLTFVTDACTKEFGGKRSVKRGRARLARCAFPEDWRPDANTALTIAPAGKAWDVIVDGVTLQFRRRSGVFVIQRITGPAPTKLVRFTAVANQLGGSKAGLGKGTGTGVGGGGNAEGDFVSTGTIKGTGSAPVSSHAPVQIALVLGTPSGELGTLTAEEIAAVIKSRAGTLKACYQRELNRVPDLTGTVVLAISITDEGAVRSTAIDDDGTTLVNDDVHNCLRSMVTRMKFPAKGKAKVTLPLTFKQ